MLLPFREHLDFGPTPYDQLQANEGIPVIRGNVVDDVLTASLDRWKRMGACGCFLNLSNQQQTDAYICEIAPGSETLAQRHLFEEIIYVAKGRGATSVWQDDGAKVTFEWAAGAIFAIPLNSSYQHFNGSRDEPVRLFAGTTLPRMINIFHNEDFIFRNPFNFRDRFHAGDEFLRYNKHVTERYWETNLVPDVNQFTARRFSDEGERRETYALHLGRHDLRMPCIGISTGLPQHFSPPRAGRGDHNHPGRRLRDALERRRRADAP